MQGGETELAVAFRQQHTVHRIGECSRAPWVVARSALHLGEPAGFGTSRGLCIAQQALFAKLVFPPPYIQTNHKDEPTSQLSHQAYTMPLTMQPPCSGQHLWPLEQYWPSLCDIRVRKKHCWSPRKASRRYCMHQGDDEGRQGMR